MKSARRQNRSRAQAAALGCSALVLSLTIATGTNASAANVVRPPGAAPGQAEVGDDSLTDVKALSANDVWIVGIHASSRSPYTPVIRHFDGSTWTRMGSLPHPHGNWCAPNSIDGLTDDDMWVACRWLGVGKPGPPLVAHWDGIGWHLQDIADVDGLSDMWDIWVDTPSDIWAVGNYRPPGRMYALIEHYDGHVWKRMHVKAPANTELRSVSGTSPTDVWAVGDYNQGGYSRSVTLHYDGAKWSTVESLPPPAVVILYSAVAIAPDDVWAVGTYAGHDSTENPRGLLLHWDGAQWVDVRTDAVGNYNYLSGVSALNRDEVWVVGTDASKDPNRPFAVHWDGSSWTSVPPRSAGRRDPVFTSVSADAHDDVWAVGWWWTGERTIRMYQRWDGTQWRTHVP